MWIYSAAEFSGKTGISVQRFVSVWISLLWPRNTIPHFILCQNILNWVKEQQANHMLKNLKLGVIFYFFWFGTLRKALSCKKFHPTSCGNMDIYWLSIYTCVVYLLFGKRSSKFLSRVTKVETGTVSSNSRGWIYDSQTGVSICRTSTF